MPMKDRERLSLLNTRLGMISRCYNPRNLQYKDYGGRGIAVCDRWLCDYTAFIADVGPRPAGMTLDRIDNDGDYEPGNVRWATRAEQQRNRRNNVIVERDGRQMILADACREAGLPYNAVRRRIFMRGWPVEKALSKPMQQKRAVR